MIRRCPLGRTFLHWKTEICIKLLLPNTNTAHHTHLLKQVEALNTNTAEDLIRSIRSSAYNISSYRRQQTFIHLRKLLSYYPGVAQFESMMHKVPYTIKPTKHKLLLCILLCFTQKKYCST
jgi:hypothetical protein